VLTLPLWCLEERSLKPFRIKKMLRFTPTLPMRATQTLLTGWNQKMAKMAFRRSRFRRLAWGDGDPYPYTPRATFRYQWEDWPTWEKTWHVGMMTLGGQLGVWFTYTKYNHNPDWAREEALRRMRLRREAQELMILEGEVFEGDLQPDRR
jgi:hypothetical protein